MLAHIIFYLLNISPSPDPTHLAANPLKFKRYLKTPHLAYCIVGKDSRKMQAYVME